MAGLSPFNPEVAATQAGRIMLAEVAERADKHESFAFETTLSGHGYARHIVEWRKIGYRVELFFLSSSRLPGNLVHTSDISHVSEADMDTAKVFWSGRSQAVRLPLEYRFNSAEVRIRRHGSAVILEPVATNWSWLDALTGPLDNDFTNAVAEPVPEQERAHVDAFFK